MSTTTPRTVSTLRTPTVRVLVFAAAVAVAGMLSGCGAGGQDTPAAAMHRPAVPSTEQLSGPQPIPATAAVTPTRVLIPAIGVDQTGLEQLHRAPATGELNPPVDFDKAGYYADGPTPGDPGPAVIAGHVDDTSGPKVFYRLRELTAGDQVLITRSDHTNVTFRVDAVKQYPKGAFPTDAVYGPAPGSSLRLITCGGSFDATARSYRDNIVVYASEVSTTPLAPAG